MNATAPVVGRIRNPAELAAAVPHLLGFHPRDSIVLITIRAGAPPVVGLTLRGDLPPPGQEAELIEQLTMPLLATRPMSVMLVVVGSGQLDPDHRPPGGAVVAAIRNMLDGLDVPVAHAMWVESTAAGARWACFDEPDCAGVLPDPSGTALAAASAVAGVVTFDDRTDLERLVAPDDDGVLQRRAALLDAAVEAADRERGVADSRAAARDLRLVRTAVHAAAGGRLPSADDEVVRLVVALSDPLVRDSCLELCLGETAHAAEQLWLALTRATPEPEVAEPAALAALSAYLRGDGALAGIALDRAEQAWPGHNLTTLLRFALQTAVPPGRLEQFVADAATDAELSLNDEPS